MKAILLTVTALTCLAVQAFPLSGRQYDKLVIPSELYILRVVFASWQARAGVLIVEPQQSASSMLQVMLGHGRGYGITRDERRLIMAVDLAVLRRVKQ